MNGVLDEYFQKIEDFVLVEDKIVTYKWIAKTLKVHVNTAKQLLHAFSLKEEFNDKLLVTYLIADKLNDGSHRFCLVLQDEVVKIKETLNDIISLHVYSIQRNTSFNAKELYNADCTYVLNEDDRKLCPIQKNEDIVKKISSKSSVSAVVASKTRQNIIEKPIENKSSSRPVVKPDIKSTTKEGSPTKSVQSTSSPKKEIIKNSPTKNTISKSKKSPKKLKNAATKGSIGALFSKQASNALNKKPVKVTVEENDEKEETKENLGQIINGTNDENNSLELNDSIVISTPARENGKQNSRSKKRKKKGKEHEPANKRRKRIVIASDSESCDSDRNMEEEYREPTPEPIEEEVPSVLQESDEDEIIPPTPFEQGKRKRIRKDVDKTFTDEEGFFVTNKEHIYESCSDDETPSANLKVPDENRKLSNINDDVKTNDEKLNVNNLKDEQKVNSPKKNKDKNSKKKKSKSPKKSQQVQKKQQATIMNFFKKM